MFRCFRFEENLVLTLPTSDIDEREVEVFFDREEIDAVLCVNELFAVQCMSVVQNKGLRIPEDIAFIGFTDGFLSKYSNPALTTVAQHGDKMGAIAAKMLIERVEAELEPEKPYRTEVVEATIVKRQSTAN